MFGKEATDGQLFEELYKRDVEAAEAVRAKGCGHCGGKLDRADYERKARGVPAWAERWFRQRLSLCCRRCRRRTTPESVRFLGRRVYAAFRVALTGDRETSAHVPKRTVRRWQSWWTNRFVRTACWQACRGALAEPVAASQLPKRLLEMFAGTFTEQLKGLLRFVAPVTTSAGSRMMEVV